MSARYGSNDPAHRAKTCRACDRLYKRRYAEWLWVGRRMHAFPDGQSYVALCGARQGRWVGDLILPEQRCKRCTKAVGK